MNDPTFRLEGVVHSKNEMEDFEGPLTLILQLLSKNKIEIQDIKISELLDQYLAYLEEMKAMDLEIASEFVAMASHLVYIKARVLLSTGEEPTELEELMQSLEKLKNRDVFGRIKIVAPELENMYKRGSGTFVKPPEYLPKNKEYNYSHDKGDILDALVRVLTREDAAEALKLQSPHVAIPSRIIYPVSNKTEEILKKLGIYKEIKLEDFFNESKSRTELVATFIAMLELCREGNILFAGEGADMTVSKKTEVE